MRFVLVFK